ncbi:MAG: hypothetical protein GX116_06625 [Fibrobacter sp.]|nr:hypothetical protein [Fibrobacter sp.]
MKRQHILKIIQKENPLLETNSKVVKGLLDFFGGEALLKTEVKDLITFLKPNCLFNKIEITGDSAYDCVQQLLIKHPLVSEAKGSIRYYHIPKIDWNDIEKAESKIGDAFAMDIYDWEPDAFSVFKAQSKTYKLHILLSLGL